MVIRAAGLQEERNRKQFNRQAKKAKKRWLVSYFRQKERNGRFLTGFWAAGAVRRFMWLLGGGIAAWMSWQLVFATIEFDEKQTEAVYRKAAEEADPEYIEWKEADGWEKELFGVQIRVRDGKITIFQEKQQVKEESSGQ